MSTTGTVVDLHGVAVPSTRRPGTRAVIAVGGDGTILRSVDGGRIFAPVASPVTAHLVGVAVDPTGFVYAVSGDGAVLRSTDGGASFAVRSAAPTSPAGDRKSTRLNSSHPSLSRMPSSA